MRINPETICNVYDMDDIMHPYNKAIAENCGVDLNTWEEFYVPNNNWPEDIKARLGNEFLNPEYYRNIQFFPGVENILKPYHDFGVPTIIISNSSSDETAALKLKVLMDAIPGLTEEMIIINRITLHQNREKKLPKGTFIYVEDNPYHIIKSTAKINLLHKWPWNTSKSAMTMLKSAGCCVHLNTLEEINDFVYQQTKHYFETGDYSSSSAN